MKNDGPSSSTGSFEVSHSNAYTSSKIVQTISPEGIFACDGSFYSPAVSMGTGKIASSAGSPPEDHIYANKNRRLTADIFC